MEDETREIVETTILCGRGQCCEGVLQQPHRYVREHV